MACPSRTFCLPSALSAAAVVPATDDIGLMEVSAGLDVLVDVDGGIGGPGNLLVAVVIDAGVAATGSDSVEGDGEGMPAEAWMSWWLCARG